MIYDLGPVMNCAHFSYASAAILALALSAVSYGVEPQKLESMEGAWVCSAATINGKQMPETTVKLLRLTMTKDRYKTEKGDEVLFDSTYTLDSTTDPKQINMVGTEGDLKGKEAHGIYS